MIPAEHVVWPDPGVPVPCRDCLYLNLGDHVERVSICRYHQLRERVEKLAKEWDPTNPANGPPPPFSTGPPFVFADVVHRRLREILEGKP